MPLWPRLTAGVLSKNAFSKTRWKKFLFCVPHQIKIEVTGSGKLKSPINPLYLIAKPPFKTRKLYGIEPIWYRQKQHGSVARTHLHINAGALSVFFSCESSESKRAASNLASIAFSATSKSRRSPRCRSDVRRSALIFGDEPGSFGLAKVGRKYGKFA